MTLMPLTTGCIHSNATKLPMDDFCLWAKPIYLTKAEIASLGAYSSNEIADYNDAYFAKCVNKK